MEAMTHLERAVEVSRALRAAEFKVALDDFGLGLAATEHIRALGVHTMKIDRAHLGANPLVAGSSAIVQYAVELAAILGIDVVAEGVETPTELDALRSTRLPDGPGLPVLAADHRRRDAGAAAALRCHPRRHGLVGRRAARHAAPAARLGCRDGGEDIEMTSRI